MELNQLKSLISNKLEALGYELVELTFSHNNGQDVLNIVVDKEQEIDMNMIVDLTNEINAYLDEINPFEKPYTLDLSSLGAEKPLKVEKLGDYVERYIHVHLINPINGENIYEGTLKSVSDESISLEYKVKTRIKVVDIQKANISKIRLAIKF